MIVAPDQIVRATWRAPVTIACTPLFSLKLYQTESTIVSQYWLMTAVALSRLLACHRHARMKASATNLKHHLSTRDDMSALVQEDGQVTTARSLRSAWLRRARMMAFALT